MKQWFVVLALFAILSLGAGWSMTKWAPWWRVEGRDELAGAQVKFSRVKLSWVFGQLGVWEKGVRGRVPEKVVFIVNANTYDREKFIDGPSDKVLYAAYDEFVDGNTFMISIGLPNIDFFGEPKKMTAILNNQTLRTIVRLTRDKTFSSAGSLAAEIQVILQRLPEQMTNSMINIK